MEPGWRAERKGPGTLATPEDYEAWRSTALGRISESLERAPVFEPAGPANGRHMLDLGAGDGSCVFLHYVEQKSPVNGRRCGEP